MPLQGFAVEIQAKVARFLRDDRRNLLILRSEPELERMGAKLVAGLGQDERTGAVVLGASAPFQGAAPFLAAVRQTIAASVAAGVDELRTARLDPGPLADLARTDPLAASPEIAFAAHVERLTRALSPHAFAVVLVLRVEEVADEAAFQASVRALSAATASPRVKYVVLEPRSRPRLAPFTAARDRLVVSVVQRDPRALLLAFAQSPTARMLVVHGRDDIRPLVNAGLGGLASGAAPPEVVRVALPFAEPWSFLEGATEAVLAACRRLAADPASVPGPCRADGVSLAARFAESVERAAAAALPDRRLVVVLDPAPVADVPFLRKTLHLLAGAAASPQVKYVVLDSPEAGVAPAPFPPAEAQIETLHISPEAVESALEQGLSGGALAPVERVRYLAMLGGFALSRGQHARSLDLSRRTVEESRKLGDPAEEALAFLGLGNALYRMAEYPPAREAYAQAVTLALKARRHQLAAQALIHVGHAHFSAKEHGPASVAYEAAARYHEKLASPFGEALALTWLGEARRREERWKDAEAAFQKALERYESVVPELSASAAEGKIEVLERLARMYAEAGMTQRASELRRRARELGGKGKIVDRP